MREGGSVVCDTLVGNVAPEGDATCLFVSGTLEPFSHKNFAVGGNLPSVLSELLLEAQAPSVAGLQESDILHGLTTGGYIRNIVVVTRPITPKKSPEYVVWVHPSWLPGLYPFCSHRGRSMRVYKDLDLLVAHCRDKWGYRSGITVRLSDDPKASELRDHAESRAARRLSTLLGNEALLD